MTHPALHPGCTAVVTGAASGIGLAASRQLARLGLNLVLADLPGPALDQALHDVTAVAAQAAQVVAVPTDVSQAEEVIALRTAAFDRFGGVSVLMNNAAVGSDPGKPWENADAWHGLMAINLWGVVNGVQAFTSAMLASGKPGLIINTGSKQGITLPPGNSAYNVSKAGVRAFTELLAHELREAGGTVSAHLLIPGFTHTGMTGSAEKPDAAWTAGEVVQFMLDSLDRGDFYILCPDNAVPRHVDERRMQWAIGDIVENRPALSRWHPDYKEAFASFMG